MTDDHAELHELLRRAGLELIPETVMHHLLDRAPHAAKIDGGSTGAALQ
ncbi:hypothetical protein ACPCI1_27730 [Streptomyces seoulensis]